MMRQSEEDMAYWKSIQRKLIMPLQNMHVSSEKEPVRNSRMKNTIIEDVHLIIFGLCWSYCLSLVCLYLDNLSSVFLWFLKYSYRFFLFFGYYVCFYCFCFSNLLFLKH